MKRLYSLKGRKIFKEVYAGGKKFHNKGVRIFVLSINNSQNMKNNSKTDQLKIGIAINKKIGTAVVRNRIKRRIRSVCSELLEEMNRGFYFIIKPEHEIKNLSYNELKSNIRFILERAGVLDK